MKTTNITLKLDSAARLQEVVRKGKDYERTRRRAVARLREGLDLRWTPPRSRQELYER